jgi:TonB family protein
VEPLYPDPARRARVEGVVVLRVVIDKEGKVQSADVISGPTMLIDPAVEAVKQWRYLPWVQNGEPVKVNTTITVNFNLQR